VGPRFCADVGKYNILPKRPLCRLLNCCVYHRPKFHHAECGGGKVRCFCAAFYHSIHYVSFAFYLTLPFFPLQTF
jgi:hypothetical protein